MQLPRPLSYEEQFLAALQDAQDAPEEVSPKASVTRRNCLHHPAAHPVLLDLLLLQTYGPDYLSFEAETLQHRVPQDFGAASISAQNLQKIEAMRCLHLVDHPWERWEVFQVVICGLDGISPDLELWHPPALGQLLFGLDVFDNVRKDVVWGTDVRMYLAAVLKHEEVHVTIPPLDFLTPEPVEGLDAAKVLNAWPATRRQLRPTLPTDTVEGRQLEKLLNGYSYYLDKRQHLRSQLPLLKDKK